MPIMKTIKSKVYLIVGILVLLVIIWQLASTFLYKKVEKANQDLSRVLTVKNQLSALILSEIPAIEQPEMFADLKRRYKLFHGTHSVMLDTESVVKREQLLDKLFNSVSGFSNLHNKVYKALVDLTDSVKFIHEHHIAYMKNILRRGIVEQDYGDENFKRTDAKKGSELDIIRMAVMIEQSLVRISHIFHQVALNSHSSGIEKEFSINMKQFLKVVNTFEDYSLDVQDGLLVEELLEKGRDFERSFSSLIALEKKKVLLIKKLNINRSLMLQNISGRTDELRLRSRESEKYADYLQTILLVVAILMMGAWVFYQGRGIEKIEKNLKKTRERYHDLFEYNPNILLTHDVKGFIIDTNLRFKEELGYGKTEIIGTAFKDFISERYRPQFKTYLKTVVEEGKTKGCMALLTKSGEERILEYDNKLMRAPDGNALYIQGNARDVTEQIQTKRALRDSETKLTRAKKMEVVGLLAGGVAHDLNNILSGIVSYPELLLLDKALSPNVRKGIETIKKSGDRAASIVNDLLTIARGVANVKEALNLNTAIRDYLASPEYEMLIQFHPLVDIKTNLYPDLLNISGSMVHIEKVIMNLVSNAAEALDGKGDTVIISTENRYLEKPLKDYDDILVGEYALLIVSDNGPGVIEKDLDRLFEPFYTKKRMGRSGTGLGLAVVWNTVQDHKGYINVTSSREGTLFELFFPITREEVLDEKIQVPIEKYKGNGEKILIVDDVEEQQRIASAMLTILGYNIATVSSGEEAVKYLKHNTADLVVLDMIMDPGMNGCETYEQILTFNPEQKAIIASGFAETNDVRAIQRMGAGKYIKKPYTLEKIGFAVKEELSK